MKFHEKLQNLKDLLSFQTPPAKGYAIESPLNELDDFSLLAVFDHVGLNELINLADISARFRDLIATHHMLPIYRINEKRSSFDATTTASVESDSITVSDFKTILLFLRHYGHLVTTLEFTTARFTDAEITAINEHIVEHCSTTLIEIDLVNPTALFLNETNVQFVQIKAVTITSFITWDSLRIHQIFPAMRRLTFVGSTYIPPLNHHFSHLESLTLSVDNDNQSIIVETLRLNQQLREFTIGNKISSEFLYQVSHLLPNLEVLNIGCSVYSQYLEARHIHFSSVRSFTLTVIGKASNIPERPLVTFDHLEHMRIHAMTITDVPMDLFHPNDALKSLALPQTMWTDTFVDLFGIVGRFPTLEELTIQWTNTLDENHVRQLLHASTTLKKLVFIAWSSRSSDDIAAIMPATWHLTHVISEKMLTINLYKLTFELDP